MTTNKKIMVTQKEITDKYKKDNGKLPSWANKKWREMKREERVEYAKYRARLLKKAVNPKDKMQGYYEEVGQQVSTSDLMKMVTYTSLDDERKNELRNDYINKIEEENRKAIVNNEIVEYCEKYNIDNQEKLNYAIEHDVNFKTFLEDNKLLEAYYTGKVLGEMEEEREKFNEQIKNSIKKKKEKKKILPKKDKNKTSNIFEKAKLDNSFENIRNKKLEEKGCIKVLYLRRNGRAELRYVKVDEIGQIKIDGYVYHERDAPYRFGKKNEPLLVILEGSLIPIHREILKENLGTDSAEAQKLIIKSIEETELVKVNDSLSSSKERKAPNKWAIIIGIGIIVALYLFLSKGG